ncbi:PadR family transcriptional regulator [Saccharopolyspora erythraea NRRL 2338]|uniref:Transcriptional regulator n=2 Tax=Saccharopolyspora erythraea TaxID=1836 RepID=A4F7W5_SACEN|nr:helix-turn-helix transcriptional regulator [Saccharopolyspora erythraea]EQD85146.1 PadR family transcriptional regulator [Saccharopolyspora erythraea D]PFG93936.1 PadR family transcriptional regulator [Saccharopolyspora erythraea NRRL 2338]QRK90759.1 helix-turn-helix transcriptional regulator [Saccharopolyspora erythraea]CAM00139.1 transcriptional regulator [Saccharopolyspora erythraea NRRL 2338]
MSATKLLVLGVLRMHGRAHGYQVRRELLSWSADRWANVRQGSIYNALRRLAKDGLLAQEEAEPGEAGPERTAYRLTEDGEAEFDLLLRRTLVDPDSGIAISAAIPFLPFVGRKELIDLLSHRRVKTESALATTRHLLEGNDEMGKPAHVRELFRLWAIGVEGDLRWIDELVGRLEAGEYRLAGEAD